MATVNFSVPQDVKDAFNRTFHGHNKSAILAELMRKAVAEAALHERRQRLFEELTEARRDRPALAAPRARRARQAGRP